jgi:DNA-binding transcriptional regulator YiaG
MASHLHGCPEADAYGTTLYARTLHRACLQLGGIQQLAEYLGVSEQKVESWLTGYSEVPQGVFLRAVDIIVGHPSRG